MAVRTAATAEFQAAERYVAQALESEGATMVFFDGHVIHVKRPGGGEAPTVGCVPAVDWSEGR